MLQYLYGAGSAILQSIKFNGVEYLISREHFVCTYAGDVALMHYCDLYCAQDGQWYTIEGSTTMSGRIMTPIAYLSFITEQEACDILKEYLRYLKERKYSIKEQELCDILKAHAPHLLANFEWSDNINK